MKNKELMLTLHPKHMHIRTAKPLKPISDSSFHRRKRMTALPAVSEEYVKPKVVLFYKNGDRNFRGSHVTVTSRRFRNFDNLLNELTRITNLSQGARYIFTPETGTRIGSLDELSDGKSYVCGSYPRLKKIHYNHSPDGSTTQDRKKKKNFVPAISKQKLDLQKDSRTQTNVKPKIIHIIRNGISVKQKVTKVLLNKRTAQSYEQVLNDITATVGVVSSGFVRKLYNKNGKLVVNLSELFGDDDIFIAVGSEKFRPSDAPSLVEEAGLGKLVSKSNPSLRVMAPVSPVPSPPKTSPLKKKKTRQVPLSQHKKLPSIGKRAEPEGEPAKPEDINEPAAQDSPFSNVTLVSLNEDKGKPEITNERSVEDILQDFMEDNSDSESKTETVQKPVTPQKEQSVLSDHSVKNESPRLYSASSKHSESDKDDDDSVIGNENVISDVDGSDTDSSKSDNDSEDDIKNNNSKNIEIKNKNSVDSNTANDDADKSEKSHENDAEKNVREQANNNADVVDILAVIESKEDPSESEELYTERITKIFNDSSEIDEYYEIGNKLGDGNFAVVNKVTDKRNDKTFAMKIIDAAKMEGKLVMLNNEIKIQRSCSHPNIVRLYHDMHSPTKIYLIMELVTGGDFFDLIANNVSFDEEDASTYMRDLCSGLDYLHQREIVHRDIKPENLMVYETNGQIILKIADFGLAMKVTSPIYTICGTPTYVAPEILTEEGYGLEVDVWAAGIILYIMLCGFPPFRSPNRKQTELFDLIEKGEFVFLEPYWDDVSSGAKDLISKTLTVNKKSRFTASQIFKHEWLVQFRLSRNNTLVDITPRKSNRFKTAAKGIQSIERMKLLLGAKLEREQFITHVHDHSSEIATSMSGNDVPNEPSYSTRKDDTKKETNDSSSYNDFPDETKDNTTNDDVSNEPNGSAVDEDVTKETNGTESDDDNVVHEAKESARGNNVTKEINDSTSDDDVANEVKGSASDDDIANEGKGSASDDDIANEGKGSASDDDVANEAKGSASDDDIANEAKGSASDNNSIKETNDSMGDDDVTKETSGSESVDDDVANEAKNSARDDNITNEPK